MRRGPTRRKEGGKQDMKDVSRVLQDHEQSLKMSNIYIYKDLLTVHTHTLRE